MSAVLRLADVLNGVTPPRDLDLLPLIRAELAASGRKIIVLDDDPTGTQTVADVPVLTTIDHDLWIDELNHPRPLAYLLTNSRSLTTPAAVALAHEITFALQTALRQVDRPVEIISRSDSTLRGHFPQELYAVAEGMAWREAAFIVVPAFFEGGRYTYYNVHYVTEGDQLIPVAQTEYAQDAYFGYRSSNLVDWILEKHHVAGLALAPAQIESIPLALLRTGDVEQVSARLAQIPTGSFCVVNALHYHDLEVFVAALAQQEQRFLARSAASYVRVRAGLEPRALLRGAALLPTDAGRGGLVAAGSYIQKSSRQIEHALRLPNVHGVVLSVPDVLDAATRSKAIAQAAEQVNDWLSRDEVALLYTSREQIRGGSEEQAMYIGEQVASALVEVVAQTAHPPRWLIAKGGITSSDVATKALKVRRAMVQGQLLPGVPVWRTEPESRFPALTYVVFPGNVGSETGIAEAITLLQEAAAEKKKV